MTDDRAAIAARHQQSFRYPSYTSADVIHICLNCQVRWPCDTARALALPPDPERLARALARRADRTDAWVLLPKEMQDLWRKDAAAIVAAWEEEA